MPMFDAPPVTTLITAIVAANIGPTHNVNARRYAYRWLKMAQNAGNVGVDQLRGIIGIGDTGSLFAPARNPLIQAVIDARAAMEELRLSYLL